MPAGARESSFDRMLGGLGRVLEEVESGRHGKPGAGAVGDAAMAWVLGRTFHPRHVNWPRLIAATAAGVVLGELVEALTSRRRDGRPLPARHSRVVEEGPSEGDSGSGPGPRSARAVDAARAAEAVEAEILEDAPRPARRAGAERAMGEAEDAVGRARSFLERAGADLAVAAAYASIAYPRLPGPPFLRAALFGAADVVVSRGGGVAAMLAGLSPRTRLPLARLLPEEDRRVERALALALALGLIYRDEDDEDDDA